VILVEKQDNRQNFVPSYHDAWKKEIRVWIKIPTETLRKVVRVEGFFISMQDGMFFLVFAALMWGAMSIGWTWFHWFVQIFVIPGAATYLIRRFRPDGKNLLRWLTAGIHFLVTPKEVDGNFKKRQLARERMRILTRHYPGE